MVRFTISLGSEDRVKLLYSYPNSPKSTMSLADTVLHWFKLTLLRDGFTEQGARASVRVEGPNYFLDLEGPPQLAAYGARLPKFLSHGWDALGVVKELQKPTSKPREPWPDWLEPPAENKLWDPRNSGQWRFFLPLGMAMINQRVLQFFHYPPIRLLDPMQDYLKDPVPDRLIELLKANDVASDLEAWLYSTVLDGAPIAAPGFLTL